MIMPEGLRGRVVHGWAFRDHTPEDVAKVRTFLDTGLKADLPSFYHKMFDVTIPR